MGCHACRYTGFIREPDFDNGTRLVACPLCTPTDDARARLAQAFGTDKQRAEIRDRARRWRMLPPRTDTR